MAKDRFMNRGGASKPDPGLADLKARVKAQREEAAKARTPGESKPDPGLAAMKARVRQQREAAQAANAERDAQTLKAGRAALRAATPRAPRKSTKKSAGGPARTKAPSSTATHTPSAGD